MAWFILLLTGTVIVLAGIVLARQGAAIADRTGIGHVWAGALLVAAVTSMPELVTDSIAVLRDAPDLATGDLFGSNMANMAILGGMAVIFPHARVLAREAVALTIAASIAIMMTGIAVLFMVARLDQNIAGAVGLGSIGLVAAWAFALVLIPAYREVVVEEEPGTARSGALWRPAAAFAAAGCAIIAAAPFLVNSAEDIVRATGLGETFIGVLLLAVATSLPELVTSIAAVRAGNLDLAVGNLYGSNATNMLFLVWLDLLDPDTLLLEAAHPSNAVAGIVAILMMMIGLMAMALRAQRRRFPLDPAGALIVVVYVIGLLMVADVSGRGP